MDKQMKEDVSYEMHKFFSYKQQPGQSVEQYVSELKKRAIKCNLGELQDSMVKNMIICGINDATIRKRLVQNDALSIQEVINECIETDAFPKKIEVIEKHNQLENEVKKKTTQNICSQSRCQHNGKTPGVGADYEVYVPAYFALILNNNSSVEDFTIQSNVAEFGNLDDIVIDVKIKNGEHLKFAFQLKHKEKKYKKISPKSFETTRGDFSLSKYCNAFKQMKDETKKYHFILYTNANFNVKRKNEVTNFTMLEKDPTIGEMFFNTSPQKFKNIYRFKVNGSTQDEENVNKADYQQFLAQFSLYTGQKHFEDFEQEIFKILKFEAITLKYVNLFKKWHLGKFTNKIIDKDTINVHLIDIWLSSFVISDRCLSPSGGQDADLGLFEKAVRQFDVTVIEEQKANFIDELEEDDILENLEQTLPGHIQEWLDYYTGKYEIELPELTDNPINVMAEIMLRLAKDFKIVDRSTKELKPDLKLKILHYFFEKPLIIEFNETSENFIYETMGLYKANTNRIKFVFLGRGISTSKFSHHKIFANLQDLSKLSDLYRDLIGKCNLSFQGRDKVQLEKLIDSYDEFEDCMGTKELHKMLKGNYSIGEEKQILPDYYVPRTVSPILLEAEAALDHFTKNKDVIIINCDGKFEYIKDLLYRRRLKVVEINRYLSDDTDRELQNFILMSTVDNECSKKIYSKICQININRRVHLLKIVDQKTFMLIITTNTLESEELRFKNHVHENDIHFYFNGSVNVLCAHPGMGKSTMLKFLRNTCSWDYWTIGVDLKAHNEFFKKQQDCDEILSYFLKFDEDQFLNNIKAAFFKRHKIVIFLDGLDELERDCVKCVLDCIKELSKKGYHVWLSSRQNLQEMLEEELDIFSMDIAELTELQQVEYIEKRLQGKYTQDEVQEIVKKISDNTDIANNRQVLGVPLQLFIITQIFLDDRHHYQNLNENTFILTNMYKIFFDGRYKFSIDKLECKNSQLIVGTMDDQLQKYEIPALQALFDDDTFGKLNLDLRASRRFLDGIKTDKDPLGIIVKLNTDDKAIFEHYTYAEYFACAYLSSNFDKVRMLKRDLFREKYQHLMLILNIMLAEDCPLHLAVIYKNPDQIKKHLGYIHKKDRGGRNALHLASCNGTRHPVLKHYYFKSYCVVYGYDKYSIEKETVTNRQILDDLSQIDPFEEDTLFAWNSLNYALTSECLYPIEAILERFGNSTTISDILEEYYDDVTIAFYSSMFSYGNLLSTVLVKRDSSIINMTNLFGESLLELSVNTYDNLTSEECATNMKIINLLIDHGIDVNTTNVDGYTALHKTAQKRHFDRVKLLVERGASVNAVSNNRRTVLHQATHNSDIEVINLLLGKGVDVNATDISGQSALFFAVNEGSFQAVNLLLKHGANINLPTNDGITPLHQGAIKGNLEIIKLLLTNGAAINEKDKSGNSPLFYAAQQGHFAAFNLLLQNGADLNTPNNYNETTLHKAALGGNIKILALTLNKGLDVNTNNVSGEAALHLAASVENFDAAISLLLEKGAELNAVTSYGETALHKAARSETTNTVGLLLNEGIEVNVKNEKSETALHLAVRRSHYDIVSLLLDEGADGSNALHCAVERDDIMMIDLLLSKGVCVDGLDKDGKSALQCAAEKGYFNSTKVLLDKGASVEAITSERLNALHFAVYGGKVEMVKLLTSRVELGRIDVNDENYPLFFALRDGGLQAELLVEMTNVVQKLCRNYWYYGNKGIVRYLTYHQL